MIQVLQSNGNGTGTKLQYTKYVVQGLHWAADVQKNFLFS
jgi:hypothetical protein